MEVQDFNYVREMVRSRSAIVLEDEKSYLVESRLQPLARREGFVSIAEMVTKLRSNGYTPLHSRVVEAMTTNETSFYRDVQPFEALRKSIVPELMAKRSATRQLRIWCAACSTGQEPYSLAMLLKEHFPQLAGWDVRILATDLSTQVLEKARAGAFNQIEVNRGLPAALLLKYFERVGPNWQLKECIRQMIEFRPLNLIEAWPPLDKMDLVLIRNVLIYFDVQTKKSILGKIRRLMSNDSVLFLGGAESTVNLDDAFCRFEVERTSVYRLR